jgi:hypothetical protein
MASDMIYGPLLLFLLMIMPDIALRREWLSKSPDHPTGYFQAQGNRKLPVLRAGLPSQAMRPQSNGSARTSENGASAPSPDASKSRNSVSCSAADKKRRRRPLLRCQPTRPKSQL